MASYKDLTARINALQARAEVVRKQEAAKFIKQAKATIAAYGLTAEDLGLTQSKEGQGPAPTPKAARKASGVNGNRIFPTGGNLNFPTRLRCVFVV